jgi:hypothetical protein
LKREGVQKWLNSLRVFRLFGDVARGVKAGQRTCCEKAWEYQYQNQIFFLHVLQKNTTHKDKSQFHPGGAPVPLSYIVLLPVEHPNRPKKKNFR